MALPIVSQHRANVTFRAIILIGLGILFFTDGWWPGILLVIGTALCIRQGLRGRYYDVALSTLIFLGLFIGAIYRWEFSYFLPVLFTLAGLYLLYTEWFVKRERVGNEAVEDIKQEMEDADRPD